MSAKVSEARVQCYPLSTRRATRRLGKELASVLRGGDLIVLDGTLGAGKTFLVRALCRALGLSHHERVTSPTFALVQEFPTAVPLVHADVYRLDSETGVADLGLLSRRAEGAAVVVEWGLPFVGILGGDALVVSLRLDPRRAEIRATGPRSATMARALPANIEPARSRC